MTLRNLRQCGDDGVSMAVKFQLDRLKVSNFRGLPTLEFEIPSGTPLHIIGSNNSGKSTALQAIAFAFKSAGSYQHDLEPFDFYRPSGGEHCKDFFASVTFKAEKEEELPAVQGIGNPVFVHGVCAKGKLSNTGHMTKSFGLLDSNGKMITLSPQAPLKGDAKEKFAGHKNLGWSPQYARHDDIREYLPEVMLLTPQNAYQSLYVWRTGPLNKIAAYLASELLQHKWTYNDRKMPDSISKAHEFLAGAVENFPLWKDTVRPAFATTLSEYIGKNTKLELRPTIQAIEQWMQQQLLLSFAADEYGTVTPMQRMGDGWQSLIRLAALEVLTTLPLDNKRSQVLLFEEPETYLHPHLRRRLRRVLCDLAKKGWTVVTTTHAPEFASLTTGQTILKLRRSANAIESAMVQTSKLADAIRWQAKIDDRGNGELFFANRVIVCEGKDDEFAMKTWLEKRGVETDARSVSIIDVGSRNNIPDFVALLRELGTPWCALTDEDRLSDGTYKPKAETTANKINALCSPSDLHLQCEIDMEHCYGIPRSAADPSQPDHKATAEWQWSKIAAISVATMDKDFPKLAKVVSAIQAWLN